MDIKYPVKNKYMKCVFQINGFSGSRRRGPIQPLGMGHDSASIHRFEVLKDILDADTVL